MTQSRDSLISLSDTPYYHCIYRCVRRAFLCGEDKYTEQSFDHRRQWVIDRVKYLTDVFHIEVCVYAIMSNHYHLVLRWQKGELSSDIQKEEALKIIAEWLLRLSSIYWLIRCHPWRSPSPFGPAKAVLICSRQISGLDV